MVQIQGRIIDTSTLSYKLKMLGKIILFTFSNVAGLVIGMGMITLFLSPLIYFFFRGIEVIIDKVGYFNNETELGKIINTYVHIKLADLVCEVQFNMEKLMAPIYLNDIEGTIALIIFLGVATSSIFMIYIALDHFKCRANIFKQIFLWMGVPFISIPIYGIIVMINNIYNRMLGLI